MTGFRITVPHIDGLDDEDRRRLDAAGIEIGAYERLDTAKWTTAPVDEPEAKPAYRLELKLAAADDADARRRVEDVLNLPAANFGVEPID